MLPDSGRKSFSLASATPKDGHLELHVRHVKGGRFTDKSLKRIAPGTTLQLARPYGRFSWTTETANQILMLASGTGYAPLKALLEHKLASGLDVPITLYWRARDVDDIYAWHELSEWAERHDLFEFVAVLSDEVGHEELGTNGGGSTGHLTALAARLNKDFDALHDVSAYVCGSRGFVEQIKDYLQTKHLPADRFHFDPFEPASHRSARPIRARITDRDSVGRDLLCTAEADVTLLPTLRRSGYSMQSVCGGKGICGTCVVKFDAKTNRSLVMPSRDENEILDMVAMATSGCRLACQSASPTVPNILNCNLSNQG